MDHTAHGISMFFNYDKSKLQDNVKRQSKRLAKLLNIPLSKAQYLLSVYVYLEPSYYQLKAKLNSRQDSENLFFALVATDSEEQVLEGFVARFEILYSTLEQSPINELCNGAIKDLIFEIFGLSSEVLPSA